MNSLYKQLNSLPQPTTGHSFAQCRAGHKSGVHAAKSVIVTLNGPLPISDILGIAESISLPSFPMVIYNWEEYFNRQLGNETIPKFVDDNGKTLYCPGQDIISYCIERQGIWEPFETPLILDILKQLDSGKHDCFIDYGSHIGFYSIIAALRGYNVVSIDASAENLALLNQTAQLNNVSESLQTLCRNIDNTAPVLEPSEHVRLLKCDVEGFEPEAYAMSKVLFEAKKIDYAIFEVSPVFNSKYSAMVQSIVECGYDVYQIPDKGYELKDEFALHPLATTIKNCQIKPRNIETYVKTLKQENFLFAKQ